MKTKVKRLEKQLLDLLEKIRLKKNNGCKYPAPLFFRGDESDLEQQIKEKTENYRRQGYSERAISITPIYIMNELAD